MDLSQYKKLTKEQLKQLLHMRKRHFVKDNKKKYIRKEKHKIVIE